jgi:hypothetical protein
MPYWLCIADLHAYRHKALGRRRSAAAAAPEPGTLSNLVLGYRVSLERGMHNERLQLVPAARGVGWMGVQAYGRTHARESEAGRDHTSMWLLHVM